MLLAIVSGYLADRNNPAPVTVSLPQMSTSAWEWENPYTFRLVSIPADWQRASTDALSVTVLALSHATERSLVYLTYEETIDVMSLEEYVEFMRPANNRELGTEEFSTTLDEQGREVFVSSGAKYFDDKLVLTNIRIWSDQPSHFWRSVSITDAEYRDLEYRALDLLQRLEESTVRDE